MPEQEISPQAQRLLRRIERREIIGLVPQPVWQELTHKLMLAEAMMLGQITGGNPAKQLGAKPGVVKRLTIYRDKVTALVTLGLGFEACTQTDLLDQALFLQERYGLLTNDSVIAAVALRLDADALVSADTRFKVVKDLTIYLCSLGSENGLVQHTFSNMTIMACMSFRRRLADLL